jgi:type I restriction enzyme R subunit
MQSNFLFLEDEFPILFNIGYSAELNLHTDFVVCLFKLRQFGEKITEYVFEEHQLGFPSDNSFHNRLKELFVKGILPATIKDILFAIKDKGNIAVHQNKGTFDDAKYNLFSTFKVAKWFFDTYSKSGSDISGVKYHLPDQLASRNDVNELESEYKKLEERFNQLLNERQTSGLSEEKQQVLLKRSQEAAKKIEMSEAETREIIDAQLRLAGWEADSIVLNAKTNKTRPVKGKNIAIAEWAAGSLRADYALFVGKELYGIVEAKKYANDISTDLRQSKIYAENVEAKQEAVLVGKWGAYRVPFLFSTNGRAYLEQIKTKSGIWFLDVRKQYNTSRPLQGWFSPEGLVKLLQKDLEDANRKLTDNASDFLSSKNGLGLRQYQIDAIKAIEKVLVDEPDRRQALIAMATGTGKTRTIIGLCYNLIKANRFKRILFLVDRTLLGIQAVNAFKDNKVVGLNTFADIYDVKALKDIAPDNDTRLHFATVQGMVKRLFYNESAKETPTVDEYDCIIIDEAHRGYLLDRELDEQDLEFKDQMDYVSKYRMVLDYFDAFAVGLTATPALHTKEIFGSPVYIYSYREAVIDGFLIDHEPPYIIKTKLNEEGVKWEKGEKPKAFDKESNSIVELDELQDELNIDVSGFNKQVIAENFNRTVIKQLVNELDPEGDEKALIFAATDEHADNIVLYLKEEFQNIGIDIHDDAIQKITGKSYNPEELVKRFKNEKYPTIAVTVDLLTTGVDVPSICNIVFMRRVKSRILYEQMLGRATRRCDEIAKETFKIYDAVGIYKALEDYTQMQPVVVNPKTTFEQLVGELQHINTDERAHKQIEQIIAKLQGKKRIIGDQNEDQFKYFAKGSAPDELISFFKSASTQDGLSKIEELNSLWRFLDEFKPSPKTMLVAEHEDVYRGTERGYGSSTKPEDYLESFTHFITTNQNKIAALNVICTRPKELDRKSLKELMIALDHEGFNAKALKAAWKDAKNEDIAANIISFIRTLAVGNALISHEDRIKNAMTQVRKIKNWNKVQEKWIDRFEKQLMQEAVLQPQDLDQSPFADAGGFQRLNKVFDNQLTEVIDTINDNLYNQSA